MNKRVSTIVLQPLISDPSTIITMILAKLKCFTAIDLCPAYFSIIVHPESQYFCLQLVRETVNRD